MCDLVSTAISRNVNRRSLLAGAIGGAAMTGAAAMLPSGAIAAKASTPTARSFGGGDKNTRLILLGTSGGPPWWNGSDRQGASSALAVGDRFYVVDAGHGVGPQARKARLGGWTDFPGGPLDSLRGIFLTHLHSDHTIDLNNLLLQGVANGLQFVDRPVQIWGPGNRGALPPLFGPPPTPPVTAPDNPTPGTREMVDLIVRAFATDVNDRVFDNRTPPPSALYTAHDVPIPPRYLADPNGNPHPRMSPVTFYEDDRVKVSATLVQHAPVFPAMAFRFDSDDGSVVFSGDTGPSQNLVELARGADVLVHEVIDSAWVDLLLPEPRTGAQEALRNHLITSHTTVEQVGPIADAAGVPTLVLNHLVPGNWPEHKFARAQKHYSGKLIVGRDLDVIGVGKRRKK